MRCAVVVPVKSFGNAKRRLSRTLDAQQRARLARALAGGVLRAAAPLPTFVVCDHPEVAEWAAHSGAVALVRPGTGLNSAVQSALDELRATKVDTALIAHADLAAPERLAMVASDAAVVVVPDRHDHGTNVLSVPLQVDFRVAFGPGSFHRHVQHAVALGVGVSVRRDPLLALDVDTPDDLRHPLIEPVVERLLLEEPPS